MTQSQIQIPRKLQITINNVIGEIIVIYLYVKTHNKTGLKYLGKTSKDPYKYLGSGLYWLRHLAKHGNDVSTEILLETEDKNEIKEKGLYYSTLWNVKESSDWANLTNEEGTGGAIFKGRKHSPESIQKISDSKKGVLFSDEHRKKISESNKGTRVGTENHFFGKHHTDKSKAKISESLSGKVRTAEFKQHLSDYWKGKKKGPMSEETKRKISEAKRRK